MAEAFLQEIDKALAGRTRALFVHSGNMYGGVERVLCTVAQAGRFGAPLDPHVALCFEGQTADILRRLGVRPTMLGPVKMTRPDLLLKARRALAATIDDLKPDVVVTPTAWAHAAFAPTVRRAGVPLVFWVHELLSGGPWHERLAVRTPPDVLVCNSHFSMSAARQVFPGVPAEVVYCPLRFEQPREARAAVRDSLGAAADVPVILNVARMEPLKGQAVLIDALAAVGTSRPWACWIAGGAQREEEQRYRQMLVDRVARAGLADRVRFLGHRDDVAALLGAADLYVQPNQGIETFGLSVVEALYAPAAGDRHRHRRTGRDPRPVGRPGSARRRVSTGERHRGLAR